ncbi:short-chain dehydrogenase, putative [Talaromyces stipitatus ATCC 10500]|uniref:Short-chain dehydrogenase, putative n=1 Tax=Talaromyces stipitatus (strain ATCC 10500 / CBS 375.48 / QM 6759 / NRRL 1006) TaxID=441959 RepID=B8MPK5_TALSN|nr:short-chain dehydrogenase, putative [Talaromyces stipitatus ATCC 10500]EED14444.1 short-chain dehydrogenase, putative [Talaromyces stipitatus ATCC 10500]
MSAEALSLAGKVAIVTGSGRENGIGAGIAFALARNGAAVTINYVSESSAKRAEGVAQKIRTEGGKATVIRASVNEEGAKILIEGTLKAFGTDHIDILVNNAGVGHIGPTLDLPLNQIRETFAVNLYGPLFMVRAVVPHMPPGGRIINITSTAARMPLAAYGVYETSKAALDYLTAIWAEEFGKSRGITVNSVGPGLVETDIVPSDPEFRKAAVEPIVRMTRAADRPGTIEDIGDTVLLVSSEKGRWIAAQHISASGGVTAL